MVTANPGYEDLLNYLFWLRKLNVISLKMQSLIVFWRISTGGYAKLFARFGLARERTHGADRAPASLAQI